MNSVPVTDGEKLLLAKFRIAEALTYNQYKIPKSWFEKLFRRPHRRAWVMADHQLWKAQVALELEEPFELKAILDRKPEVKEIERRIYQEREPIT